MRNFLPIAAAGAALFMAATPASAAVINFAGNFSVTSNQGSGLIVDASPSSGLFAFSLDDVVGDSASVSLFKISTPESDVGGDDTAMSPITVTFNFTQPESGSVPVGGDTWGASTWTLFINWQDGHVQWDNPPPVFNFGNTGKVSINLTDTTFDGGLYGLNGKSANIKAKFKLESLPSAVPEPATWAMMITGFGLAGTAIRRRRSLAAFA